MEWVETTGRTIAAALDAALDELGVNEDDVEYEVVSEPRGGLLGRFGGGEARIRARVKPISREKPGERQRRNRRSNARPKGESTSSTPSAESRPAAATGGGAESGNGGNGGNRSRSRRRGSGKGAGSRPQGGDARSRNDERVIAPERAASKVAEDGGVAVDIVEVSIEDQARLAEDFTQGLVDAFELGAVAKTVIDDDTLLVEITGDQLGLLVGPRGATLTALEELVRTVVQHQTDGQGARINVDVAGYRAKRREALAEFTRKLAETAMDTGRPQRLEPMSSSDRKVVHDVAAEIEGIRTESEGEDPRRRVVIHPA